MNSRAISRIKTTSTPGGLYDDFLLERVYQRFEELARGERRNLLLVLDPSKKESAFTDKKGTTLDIAASLLTLLGYEAPVFGLGRSLLGNEPTLAAQEANLEQTLAGLDPDIAKF